MRLIKISAGVSAGDLTHELGVLAREYVASATFLRDASPGTNFR